MISSGLNKDNLSFSPYSNYPHNITLYLDTMQRWLTSVSEMYEINYKAILQKELKVRQILVGGFASSISWIKKGWLQIELMYDFKWLKLPTMLTPQSWAIRQLQFLLRKHDWLCSSLSYRTIISFAILLPTVLSTWDVCMSLSHRWWAWRLVANKVAHTCVTSSGLCASAVHHG